MHDQTCGLVHHQQVLVFVHHINRHGLGPEGLALERGPHFQHHLVAGLDPRGGFESGLAIQADQPLGQQLLQIAAGELRNQLHQRAVQPLCVLARAHLQGAQLTVRVSQGFRLIGQQEGVALLPSRLGSVRTTARRVIRHRAQRAGR